MKERSTLISRVWILPLLGVGLVAGHAVLFYFLRPMGVSRGFLSVLVVSAVVILVLAKHLGVLGALFRPLVAFRQGRSQKK